MGVFDTLISWIAVLAFVIFVGAKVYSHEKETLDPIIKKIKGWFIKEDEGDDSYDSDDDFELSFRGQVRDY